MFDAVLASNDTDTKYAGESGRAAWQSGSTLDAKGFGRITDLSVAMANDIALGELVAATAAAMTTPKLRTSSRRPATCSAHGARRSSRRAN